VAVVERLSKELSAEVLLLGPDGRLLHAAPPEAAGTAPALVGEVDRMRVRGARTSSSFSDDRRSGVIQPLAPAGRVRGYLAVSRATPLTTVDHSLVNVGVALVSLRAEQAAGTDEARRRLRDAVLGLLVDGHPPGRLPLAGVGWERLLTGPVRVLLASGSPEDRAAVLESVEEPGAGLGPRGAATVDDRLVVLVADDDATASGTVALGPALAWGVSDAVPPDGLADGVRQARRALAAAESAPGVGGVRRFHDLASHGIVGLVDADAARGFADTLLGPLEARDRGDLVASVRAWLAHNGQWDAAAGSLGVHRHTLRYRMRRVEELLDRSLDDPDLRTDLWVALAVRDRDATE
jgi:purine catabolism regulator